VKQFSRVSSLHEIAKHPAFRTGIEAKKSAPDRPDTTYQLRGKVAGYFEGVGIVILFSSSQMDQRR
jgi:hypothetical protein